MFFARARVEEILNFIHKNVDAFSEQLINNNVKVMIGGKKQEEMELIARIRTKTKSNDEEYSYLLNSGNYRRLKEESLDREKIIEIAISSARAKISEILKNLSYYFDEKLIKNSSIHLFIQRQKELYGKLNSIFQVFGLREKKERRHIQPFEKVKKISGKAISLMNSLGFNSKLNISKKKYTTLKKGKGLKKVVVVPGAYDKGINGRLIILFKNIGELIDLNIDRIGFLGGNRKADARADKDFLLKIMREKDKFYYKHFKENELRNAELDELRKLEENFKSLETLRKSFENLQSLEAVLKEKSMEEFEKEKGNFEIFKEGLLLKEFFSIVELSIFETIILEQELKDIKEIFKELDLLDVKKGFQKEQINILKDKFYRYTIQYTEFDLMCYKFLKEFREEFKKAGLFFENLEDQLEDQYEFEMERFATKDVELFDREKLKKRDRDTYVLTCDTPSGIKLDFVNSPSLEGVRPNSKSTFEDYIACLLIKNEISHEVENFIKLIVFLLSKSPHITYQNSTFFKTLLMILQNVEFFDTCPIGEEIIFPEKSDDEEVIYKEAMIAIDFLDALSRHIYNFNGILQELSELLKSSNDLGSKDKHMNEEEDMGEQEDEEDEEYEEYEEDVKVLENDVEDRIEKLEESQRMEKSGGKLGEIFSLWQFEKKT